MAKTCCSNRFPIFSSIRTCGKSTQTFALCTKLTSYAIPILTRNGFVAYFVPAPSSTVSCGKTLMANICLATANLSTGEEAGLYRDFGIAHIVPLSTTSIGCVKTSCATLIFSLNAPPPILNPCHVCIYALFSPARLLCLPYNAFSPAPTVPFSPAPTAPPLTNP